jgi:hypothetical protein
MCVCVCVCVRACARACVRACVFGGGGVAQQVQGHRFGLLAKRSAVGTEPLPTVRVKGFSKDGGCRVHTALARMHCVRRECACLC